MSQSSNFGVLVESTKKVVAAARSLKEEAAAKTEATQKALMRVEKQTPLLAHIREQLLSQMQAIQDLENLIQALHLVLTLRQKLILYWGELMIQNEITLKRHLSLIKASEH